MSIVVVILILGAFAVAARRYAKKVQVASGMRVVSRQSLSRHSAVAVVEADGRRFLVGTSQNDTRLLAELEPAAAVDIAEPAPVVALDQPPADQPALRRPMTVGDLIERARDATVRKTA